LASLLGQFRGEISARGTSCRSYDLWHVENGKVAEHWDIMAAETPWKNSNGKF